MKIDTCLFQKLTMALGFVAAMLLCVSCDFSVPKEEASTNEPRVALPHWYLRAVVISEDNNKQIEYSALCPVKIQARYPDINGERPSADAVAACSLGVRKCFRVTADYLALPGPSGTLKESTILFVFAVDERAAPDDFVCDESADALDADENPLKKASDIGVNGALGMIGAVLGGADFEDSYLRNCIRILEVATRIKATGITKIDGSLIIDDGLLQQDFENWSRSIHPR